ncbi:hypothetical protein GCM10008982_20950 [Anoxybacillus voinovskiensis]|nr:hypothetical protein GCM10008982_20950 [Anoxybacillus voinovskiensis]
MVEKIVKGVFVVTLVLGIEIEVFANRNGVGEDTFNFGQMLLRRKNLIYLKSS